jgi:hypothetical protein
MLKKSFPGIFKKGLLFVALAMAFVCAFAQDELKNLPEYTLPITNQKLVIAHCMTNIIRYKGHPFEDGCNPDYYSPAGNITAPLGGLTQVNVMEDGLLKNATLDEAVEFEMRTAMKCGIDGFQFYYTLGNKSWDDIIKAYFRVADQKHIDFKLTLCISHPSGSTEAAKLYEFSERINNIFKVVGHDNPHWLRTPDGRLIIYTWYGEQIADVAADANSQVAAYSAARAFKKLADLVNDKFACIYLINEQISNDKLNSYLDYFPAVWMWTLPYTKSYVGRHVADVCEKRNRTFTGSTFCDFYTSKLLKPGTWDMLSHAGQAVDAGIKHVERKYIATGLSTNFRDLLQFAINRKVGIINVITWNDYPEGHHLAPEANHNYGFSVLLNYYKSAWKNEPSPYGDKDVAIAFFKKYKQNIKPYPFYIPLVKIERNPADDAIEDSIEVVTILPSPALLQVNGKTVSVQQGLQSSKFASRNGPVNVNIIRNGSVTQQFTTPEWITDKPYRTDRITYTYCTEYQNFHRAIFGNAPPIYSLQYNADSTRALTPSITNTPKK